MPRTWPLARMVRATPLQGHQAIHKPLATGLVSAHFRSSPSQAGVYVIETRRLSLTGALETPAYAGRESGDRACRPFSTAYLTRRAIA